MTHWGPASAEKFNPDRNDGWWDTCYVPSPADVSLRGIDRSVIVVGAPGSGKTTAINAFARYEKERLFIIRYPLDCWYGEPHAWLDAPSHLSQIMACASREVQRFLVQHTDKLKALSPINLEYLRWLIEKHDKNKRAFSRWADARNYPPLISLSAVKLDDIYPTVTDLSDVQGQIEELVTLSRRFGFEGVAVLVDLNESDAADPVILDKLVELFSWLTPLQFDGFAIKAAAPESAYEKTNLMSIPRDRASFTFLHWRLSDCRQLMNRYLTVATEQQTLTLNAISDDALIDRLGQEFQALYGFFTPKIWLQMTQILLQALPGRKRLTLVDMDDILHAYYAAYVPLKFDRIDEGVWQANKFIKLDPQPFSFLEILWQYRNSDDDPDQALLNLTGKRGNLNTLASRLRKKIEPVPKQAVYIKNDRIRGYWLENWEDLS